MNHSQKAVLFNGLSWKKKPRNGINKEDRKNRRDTPGTHWCSGLHILIGTRYAQLHIRISATAHIYKRRVATDISHFCIHFYEGKVLEPFTRPVVFAKVKSMFHFDDNLFATECHQLFFHLSTDAA